MKFAWLGSATLESALAMLRGSALFDPRWYCQRYPDVEATGLDPAEHYLRIGSQLERQPSADFDAGFYRRFHPDVARAGLDPLVHYLQFGEREARRIRPEHCPQPAPSAPEKSVEASALPRAAQRSARRPAAPGVLVCAHSAPARLYGGERSFLDIVQGLERIGFDVVVALPGKGHPDYVVSLREHCLDVVEVPYAWWSPLRPVQESSVRALADLIRRHRLDAVHVNTIMLAEPLAAARACSVPGVIHARELVHHDPDLCRVIGQAPEVIVRRVIDEADAIIANSAATARCFDAPGRTWIVPNCVDPEALDLPAVVDPPRLTVGMLSSNLPKKGIEDFAQVAAESARRQLPFDFRLFGPVNEHVSQLLKRHANLVAAGRLSAEGYVDEPARALAGLQVVLNLSHFQESFGRTVAEAMAARRAVVAYDWGAVSELIEDGRTGRLVPFGDVEGVVSALADLSRDRNALRHMGAAARERALRLYAPDAYARALREAYRGILGDARILPQGLDGATESADAGGDTASTTVTPRVSVVIPNFNYARFLPERIASIIVQTLRPHEILFLDDCSSDDSIDVASRLLEASGLRFRVIANENNQGVYRQWARGVREASGDLVWIAEADDVAEPRFLERLVERFSRPDVVLAFTQSRVLDESGNTTRPDMRAHTDGVDPERWSKDYVEAGAREVIDVLVYRNTIPNVSACVFTRAALLGALDGLERFRYCGDWYLYCRLLRGGSVAFVAEALNGFRRHSASVTRSRGREPAYLQELIEIKRYLVEAFPVHARQLADFARFIDSDYRIEGVKRNSLTDSYRAFERDARERIAGRLRFALVTTNNGSFNGGSEVLWVETAQRLAAEGHDVVAVMKRWEPEPPFLADFRRLGIRTYFREDGFAPVLAFRPDLLVVSTGDQDEGTDWFDACERASVPFVVVNQLTKSVAVWPLRHDRLPAVRRGYAAARRTFFTCWNNHRLMQERLGTTIANAEVHFNPFHFDRSLQLPFPSLDAGVRIAVPARLLKIHKGQHLVIELLAQPKWRERDLLVSFYGDGPDGADLQRQARESGLDARVRFVPRVPDVVDIWRENHAILMASFMEGLPIVLVGAMMCARVPILTDVGAHREVVTDGETGFLSPETSVAGLDEALERAWQRRGEWELIGARARAAILAHVPEDPVGDFIAKLRACIADR